MNAQRLKRYEISGAVLIFASAVLLHFSYELTNGNVFAILFGSVNESVWENVKNFMLPYVLWGFVELFCLRPPLRQFAVAKTAGLYFLVFANIISFYIYTFFTGGPILAADIIFSAIWLAAAQYVSYKTATSEKIPENSFSVACFLLLLFLVMYFTFTAFPPKIDLFRDNVTGTYGIPVEGLLPESVFLPLPYEQ